jgi:hypothetical protein
LKQRSLEVIRIYRGVIEEDARRAESQFSFYLVEAAVVTLGVCYERVPRCGGSVYHPCVANDSGLRGDACNPQGTNPLVGQGRCRRQRQFIHTLFGTAA